MSRLEIDRVSVRYGRARVLSGCSITVEAGSAVALLGSNGAGKTTVLRAISGLAPIESGQVSIDGVRLDGRRPDSIVREGVVHVPEGRDLFPTLSVQENLRLGGYTRSRAETEEGVDRALGCFPILRSRARQPAGSLSGGEQQMLAIGRALVSRPRVLLLDEISLGLAPRVTEEIYEMLQRIRADGVGLLVVEQHVALALQNTEVAHVLRNGQVVLSSPSSLLAEHPEDVWGAYLGDELRRRDGRPGAAAVGRPVARQPETEDTQGGITDMVKAKFLYVAAAVLAVAGVLALLGGYVGLRNESDVALQLPYLLSGGVVGIFLLGAGASLSFTAIFVDLMRSQQQLQASIETLASDQHELRAALEAGEGSEAFRTALR